MCLLAIHMSSFEKCLFKSSVFRWGCPFSTELYEFFLYPEYWSLITYVLQIFSVSGFLQEYWVLDLAPGGAYVGAGLEVM